MIRVFNYNFQFKFTIFVVIIIVQFKESLVIHSLISKNFLSLILVKNKKM